MGATSDMTSANHNHQRRETDAARLGAAIDDAQRYLLDVQSPEGYWWGELESNSSMEAEYILLTHFLGAVDEERHRKRASTTARRATSARPPNATSRSR